MLDGAHDDADSSDRPLGARAAHARAIAPRGGRSPGLRLDPLPHLAGSVAEAQRLVAERPIDLVVLDQRLPDGPGHALCEPLLAANATAKIVFITAFPTFDNAVTALKAGAHDYLSKPFELEQLRHAVGRSLAMQALEKVERVQEYQATREVEGAHLSGGPALDPVRRLVEIAARTTSPVLITGETGTGKNVVAKSIHHAGPRAKKPFISLNLASLPESLVEAELFGWERGAFTGAVSAREGLVELAEGGTLFFDEIGEMPLHLQAKLLTMLEDREVRRLGGRGARTADVRIVAATNAELDELVAAHRFRADLYYRLDVLRVRLPPLRERLDDLGPLCEDLLARIAGKTRAVRLAPGELERMARYEWPGNVRELRNVLERAWLLHGESLRPSELLEAAAQDRSPSSRVLRVAPASQPPATAEAAPHATLEQIERRHVEQTFRECGGNLAQTARRLDVSLSTLKRMAARFGLKGAPRAAIGSD